MAAKTRSTRLLHHHLVSIPSSILQPTQDDQPQDRQDDLLLPGLALVVGGLPQLLGAGGDLHRGGLDVGLDAVHDVSLLVDHRGQVLEEGED